MRSCCEVHCALLVCQFFPTTTSTPLFRQISQYRSTQSSQQRLTNSAQGSKSFLPLMKRRDTKDVKGCLEIPGVQKKGLIKSHRKSQAEIRRSPQCHVYGTWEGFSGIVGTARGCAKTCYSMALTRE